MNMKADLKGISAANTVFAMAVSGTVVAGVLALFKKNSSWVL
jgi:hypothetical protein